MSRKVRGREVCEISGEQEFGGGETWHCSRTLTLESLAMDEKERQGEHTNITSKLHSFHVQPRIVCLNYLSAGPTYLIKETREIKRSECLYGHTN